MSFPDLRALSLKQRIFGLMLLLGLIPIACFASTFISMWRSQQVEAAFGVANKGAISLTEINAQAYAVVMESRGIYMSRNWAEAKPFAENLERHLLKMNEIVARWKAETLIASEIEHIAKLEQSVKQFTELRRQIVKLAQGEDLAAARALGDNDANRSTRRAMNALISGLADRYKAHEAEAFAMKEGLEHFNMITLVALAIGAILIGGISARSLQRTVIIVFNRMRVVMGELAAGNLNVEFEGANRKDEIGDFARAFHKFKTDALNKEAMEAEARVQAQRVEAERQRVAAEERRKADEQAQAINAFTAALGTLAAGDLMARIDVDLAPEYRELKDRFNAAVVQLREAMENVAENAGAIAGSTNEIASAAEDLSRRTEKQAATLEQTAAALNEITNAVRTTSGGADNAQELANTTRRNADKAAAIVRNTVGAVGSIERSSQQISNIIGVIDEIAFQTNLLALNAGVEAARAGDSGRGFAVVASEVRALAQRSATAAKEIKELITASTQQVQEGVLLVGDTGRSLDEIQAQVSNIADIISEIATSARTQASSLGEVNTAVTQMDQVTQQNAAMVEETTAAGRSLSDKAAELSTIVGHFKTGQSRPAQAKAPVREVPQRRAARPAAVAGNLAVREVEEEAGWHEF